MSGVPSRDRPAPPDLTEDQADLLLSGRLAADQAPPGYAEVARLLRSALAPSAPPPAHLPAEVTAALREATGGTSVTTGRTGAPRRRSRGTRLAALAAGAATVLGGTAAAAATGSLPGPAQRAVAATLSHLGIPVPDAGRARTAGAGGGSGPAGGVQARRVGGNAGSATRPATGSATGQCSAFLAGGANRSSAAFARLVAGHGGTIAGAIAYCESVTQSRPANAGTPASSTGHPGSGSGTSGSPAPATGRGRGAGSQGSPDGGQPVTGGHANGGTGGGRGPANPGPAAVNSGGGPARP